MKKFFLSLFMAAVALAGMAQKTINDPNVEKRTVNSFHGIDVATGVKLILTEGPDEEIAVSAATTEFRDKIITRVENGILKIYYETKMGAVNRKNQSKNLKAYVSYKKLDRLTVTTGAEVEIEGVLTSPALNLKANTGGLVKGKVDIAAFTVDQTTGSKITLAGKAVNLEVEGDTGSKFMGEDLETSGCSIKASTGALIYITVQKELNVKANTGGHIKYKGTASIRDIKTNTGAHVSKM